MANTRIEERSIECSLTERGVEQRTEWLRAEVWPHFERWERHPAGYRLYFDGTEEALTAVAELVRKESRCCSELEFLIGVEPPHDETVLTVLGPDGIEDLFEEGVRDRFDAVE